MRDGKAGHYDNYCENYGVKGHIRSKQVDLPGKPKE
jgi:hypothetical protein